MKKVNWDSNKRHIRDNPEKMIKHAIGAWNRSTGVNCLRALDDLRYWAMKCKQTKGDEQ